MPKAIFNGFLPVTVRVLNSYDMIWINGENFQSAKENDMLYGPFTEKLPNFQDYVDADAEDVKLDFAYPTDGYEAPYGKAQVVLIADTAVTPDLPKSAEELKTFVQEYPGKVTYPALPDFTGSAFVRNIIYEICGYEQFLDMEADKETVREAVEPAMEYLRELNPYLWNGGKTFPDSSSTLMNMFSDGEVVLNVTYDAYDTAVSIADGIYTNTTQTFQFDKGTIGNTNFMAIAKNSGNKAGAMVAINEMLSPEIQADRYDKLKVIPVLDNAKLSEEQKAEFDKVDLGQGTDRTVSLIDPQFQILHAPKGRAKQMNLGAKKSSGDILFFLHSDSELPKHPLAEIRYVMKDHEAGCFGIAFHSANFFMWTCRVISNHRIRDRKVMFGDQGIFVDRDLFFRVGMFPELPIMEDYQFSLTLKEMGIRLGIAKHRIYTSDRRFPKKTVDKLRVMWKMNRLRKMYRDGVPIGQISDLYRDVR